MKFMIEALLMICLCCAQAHADVMIIEKQGGVEQKILISGDKIQVRKRMESGTVGAGIGDRMSGMNTILKDKKGVDEAKAEYARSKGRTVEDMEKSSRNASQSAYDSEIRRLNLQRSRHDGKLSPTAQARYDELMAKKRDSMTMTEDGETVLEKKRREDMKTNVKDLEGQKSDLTSEVVDTSLIIETYRFDQNRYYKVAPSAGTYSESTIKEEQEKRSKGRNKRGGSGNGTTDLKATGEKETLNGVECDVYRGTLSMRGRMIAGDRLCIAKTDGSVAREYWNARNKLLFEVGLSSANPVEIFFASQQKSYFDDLSKLPGIPIKRTMTMGREGSSPNMSGLPPGMQLPPGVDPSVLSKARARSAGRGAGEISSIEITILSTDTINPAEFELPKGLKKR